MDRKWGNMSSAFIHLDAISRNKQDVFVDVNALNPSSWTPEKYPSDGTIGNFSDVLLRLESTNHCNFECTFCPHPTMSREKGFMHEELVKALLRDAAGLGFRSLDLRNFGEPLIDRRLASFGSYARELGFTKIYIHTNGHLLSAARLDEWAESGITDINLSLSPKREFGLTRPGIPVDKYFANLEKLVLDKPAHINCLSVDYIKTGNSTIEEEDEFLSWLSALGIRKRIDISLHNWAVNETPENYKCHRLWSSFTVLWNGDVALCCLDYDGDYILGSFNPENPIPLAEIINGPRYKEIRQNHLNGRFLAKCASCDMPKQKDNG
jgi:hypothetical protein